MIHRGERLKKVLFRPSFGGSFLDIEQTPMVPSMHCALVQCILYGRVKAPVFTCATVLAGLSDLLRGLASDRTAVSSLS